jgi:hypothetical protein
MTENPGDILISRLPDGLSVKSLQSKCHIWRNLTVVTK